MSGDFSELIAEADKLLRRGRGDFKRKAQYATLLEMRRVAGALHTAAWAIWRTAEVGSGVREVLSKVLSEEPVGLGTTTQEDAGK